MNGLAAPLVAFVLSRMSPMADWPRTSGGRDYLLAGLSKTGFSLRRLGRTA